MSQDAYQSERDFVDGPSEGAYRSALRIIENARQQKTLDLSNLQLTALPPEIGQLSALQGLNLGNNRLTALPPEIGQLSALRLLDLNDNQLTELPREIGRLTALEYLAVGDNRLTALPPEIGQLSALRLLDLRDNRLTALPPEIGQLTALRDLNLRNNPLTALPPEIGQLSPVLHLDLGVVQLLGLRHIDLSGIRVLSGIGVEFRPRTLEPPNKIPDSAAINQSAATATVSTPRLGKMIARAGERIVELSSLVFLALAVEKFLPVASEKVVGEISDFTSLIVSWVHNF